MRPILKTLAAARSTARIGPRHERFAQIRLAAILDAMRGSVEAGPAAPRVVLITVETPGPSGVLSLEKAALVLAAAGWRVLSLGLGCPVGEAAVAAQEFGAGAIVVPVAHSSPEVVRRLRRLRELLGRHTTLVVTGADAPPSARGRMLVPTLDRLDAWARADG